MFFWILCDFKNLKGLNLTEGGISHFLIEVLNYEIIAILNLVYSQNQMEIVKFKPESVSQFSTKKGTAK